MSVWAIRTRAAQRRGAAPTDAQVTALLGATAVLDALPLHDRWWVVLTAMRRLLRQERGARRCG